MSVCSLGTALHPLLMKAFCAPTHTPGRARTLGSDRRTANPPPPARSLNAAVSGMQDGRGAIPRLSVEDAHFYNSNIPALESTQYQRGTDRGVRGVGPNVAGDGWKITVGADCRWGIKKNAVTTAQWVHLREGSRL